MSSQTIEYAVSVELPDGRNLLPSVTPRGSASANPIEAIAEPIQLLPPEIRWLHAQPDMIRAKGAGTALAYGPKTRAARSMLAITGPGARAVACMGSALLLLATYLKQFRTGPQRRVQTSIFIGIGALREAALREEFAKERGGAVSYLDERGIGDFASVLRLRLTTLLVAWRNVVRSCWRQLGDYEPAAGLTPTERRIHFLTRAHSYAYFLAWFGEAKRCLKIKEPVAFSAASHVSFAAVAAGVRASYRLHGFQSRSLVYPDFEEARCFTLPETVHVKHRLPRAQVALERETCIPIATDPLVVVAGCYGQTVGYDDCISFVSWAKSRSIPVIVRPHPLDNSDFYDRWRTDPDIQFADTSMPFDLFLERCRARMVLSWYSTALFDALRRGVVPVTVGTEAWRPLDMVFPFEEISLRWPLERNLADELISNEDKRCTFLSRSREIAGLQEGGALP